MKKTLTLGGIDFVTYISKTNSAISCKHAASPTGEIMVTIFRHSTDKHDYNTALRFLLRKLMDSVISTGKADDEGMIAIQLPFTKAERKAIWEDYHHKVVHPAGVLKLTLEEGGIKRIMIIDNRQKPGKEGVEILFDDTPITLKYAPTMPAVMAHIMGADGGVVIKSSDPQPESTDEVATQRPCPTHDEAEQTSNN